MAKSKKNESSTSSGASTTSVVNSSKRELIVVSRRDHSLRSSGPNVTSASGADVNPLNNLLTTEGITLQPLFGMSEERMMARSMAMSQQTGLDTPDLSVYYRIDAPDEKLESLAAQLQQTAGIEAAYIKPPAEPASIRFNDMPPQANEPPAVTPDFTSRQGYLEPATLGIDARYAWTINGGRGNDVNIIDLEWGWNFTHEDLTLNQGGVVSGTNSTDDDHGTAVLGEFSGDRNALGITGISPDAKVSAISLVTHSTSQAIRLAADRLRAGDIILLEVHRPGPNSGNGSGQFGYIAIEWWPDDYDAIRYAVGKGVIVVEAAGNGGQNFDTAIYNTRPVNHPQLGTFPATWRNPLNPANPSSEAVVVGAGMPPPGTHGRNQHPGWGDVYADRGRCFFSNYGARVDAQGWGWEVTTTGYGDLQGGSDRNQWYTDQFSGTSSASPIVVGALASIQGALRSKGKPVLSPAQAIDILRTTGSAQQDAPAFTFTPPMAGTGYPQNHPARPATQRIGNRPNLKQAFEKLGLGTSVIKIIKDLRDKNFKEKDRKEFKEFKEFKEKEKELKEFKENKEIKEKEKELKEFKEKEIKEFKENKEIFEGQKLQEGLTPGMQSGSLETRVAQLEQMLSALTHFISGEDRPDLQTSALNQEADLQALSQQLAQQANDAKAAKDNKDIEKLREA